MDKEKIEEAKDVLFHLQHINTYLDLYKNHNVLIETDEITKWKNSVSVLLKYIDELEKDLKLEKEWRIRLDKENQDICNIVNNDFIRKSKVRELIDRYNDLDYISAHETIVEIEKIVN